MSVTIRPYRSGGWEIDIRVVTPDGARDLREFLLVDEVFRQRKPLLAICRGHQVLNVALGGTLVVAWLLIAVFAPLIAPFDPIKVVPSDSLIPPGAKHWLGTDDLGRDILSRLIYGARIAPAADPGRVRRAPACRRLVARPRAARRYAGRRRRPTGHPRERAPRGPQRDPPVSSFLSTRLRPRPAIREDAAFARRRVGQRRGRRRRPRPLRGARASSDRGHRRAAKALNPGRATSH